MILIGNYTCSRSINEKLHLCLAKYTRAIFHYYFSNRLISYTNFIKLDLLRFYQHVEYLSTKNREKAEFEVYQKIGNENTHSGFNFSKKL